MALPLQSFSSSSTDPSIAEKLARNEQPGLTSFLRGRRSSVKSSALPDSLASIAITATVVGAAATLLVKRTNASREVETPMRICDDCGGSGICSVCKGEGFMPKILPEERAEKARALAKNMATRFTSGLPKKWSYCTKCNAARSCVACGGRGKLTLVSLCTLL